MEVFFNELSCSPPSGSNEIAKNKIISLLTTLKSLKSDGFNVMRTSENFYSLELTAEYTFAHFFNDSTVSRDLKILLKGVTKSPYIEDDNSYETEIFVLSDFETKAENGAVLSPEGLAMAYIFNSPSISLTGDAHWLKESITITIKAHNGDNTVNTSIINIHSAESVAADYFRKWLKSLVDGIQLNTEENIIKVFPKDRFAFEPKAVKELISWYYDDKRFIIRIRELINDIVDNPFKGGKGLTEILAGTNGKASKRIIKKDRIVYSYSKEKIIIHRCRGHYDEN